ncbi:MAG: 3-phosphoshikimate 1-carboxyvinyltransferase [Gammaproteobacteria bacterium]
MTAQAWRIRPSPRLAGTLRVPGDKSVSHRALLLGAVATAPLEVEGFLAGDDCIATRRAVEMLGAEVADLPGGGLRITPPESLRAPSMPLDLGNAGTGIRLLCGLLAGQGIGAVLTGDASLRRRPMERVAEPLRLMGARIRTQDGCPPMTLEPSSALAGIRYELPVASAQVKSAILLAGMAAEGETAVFQPAPTRDHTERLMAALGLPVSWGGWGARIDGGGRPEGGKVRVPGDFSSAAFFLVAGLLGAGDEPLRLDGVGVNPTRTGLLEILAAMGGRIEQEGLREEGGEPVADLLVWRSELKGIDVPPELVPLAIDEFPALFVAAAAARGTTRVRGAAELRVKESDRLAVMARNLAAVGVRVREQDDGIEIQGGRISGGQVDAAGDHRVAMAFAAAAAAAGDDLVVSDVANVATSFPGFEAAAAGLGLGVETLPGAGE